MTETITDLFLKAKKENVGAIITLNDVVRGRKFTIRQVTYAFNKLVPNDEYAQNEKPAILRDTLSKMAK